MYKIRKSDALYVIMMIPELTIDHEEYLDGINAVSTPIYSAGGTLVAFLCIVGFTSL